MHNSALQLRLLVVLGPNTDTFIITFPFIITEMQLTPRNIKCISTDIAKDLEAKGATKCDYNIANRRGCCCIVDEVV